MKKQVITEIERDCESLGMTHSFVNSSHVTSHVSLFAESFIAHRAVENPFLQL
jgi:hypothetical protein